MAKLVLLEEAVARLEAANAELERVLPEKEKKLLGATARLSIAEEVRVCNPCTRHVHSLSQVSQASCTLLRHDGSGGNAYNKV